MMTAIGPVVLMARQRYFMLLFFLFSASAASFKLIEIEIDSTSARDARALLNYALPQLPLLIVKVVEPEYVNITATGGVSVHFSLSSAWRLNAGKSEAEDCERKLTLQTNSFSQRADIICGGLLGLAYSLAELHEAFALFDDGSDSGATQAATTTKIITAFVGQKKKGSAFTVRAWSEEGTLLAIPDRGYYTPDGS